MGITGFGVWLNNLKGRVKEKKLPAIVSSLFIDMNNVFHDAASDVFLYSEKHSRMPKEKKRKILDEFRQKTEEERIYLVATKIIEILFNLINTIRPKEYLVLAVDGVAPMAKITQQRKRRYKSAKDRAVSPEEMEDPENASSGVSLAGVFDSNCITPGTKFMRLIDQYIQRFINDSLKLRSNIFPEKIVYSSHLTPGEGEHKFFELVRSGQVKVETIGANVVYGLDADLTMLTLLSKLPYLYLYKQRFDARSGKENVEIVNIDTLREFVYNDLNTLTDETNRIDVETTTRDFVVMVYFVGNDFIPHIPAFEDVAKSINIMMQVYQFLRKPLTNEDGTLHWENFGRFVEQLSKREIPLLEQMAAQTYEYPFTILDQASKKTYTRFEEGTFGNDMNTAKVQVELDFPKFQNGWYENALTPITSAGKLFMKKQGIEGDPFTKNEVLDMGYMYMKGIQWILHYYLTGTKGVSSRYTYTYHHAPLLTDLYHIIQYFMKEKKTPTVEQIQFSPLDPKITPIHQLICVMPPPSWKFIPEPFRALMLTRFADLSPTNFKVEMQGIMKNKEHMGIPLLSIVDPVRLSKDLEDFNIPKEYNDRITYFVKNIRHVQAPMKPIDLRDLKRMEEKRIEEENKIRATKPFPQTPLHMMLGKIKAEDERRTNKKIEIDDREFHRRNIMIWKDVPLM